MREKKTIRLQGTEKDLYYLNPSEDGTEAKFTKHCQKTYDFLKLFIRPNATVIDIGARDGDSLLPLLAILEEGSRIIAFEPEKTEFDFLVQNLDMINTLKGQVDYNNFAIGKKTELRDFVWDTKTRNGGFKTEQINKPGASNCKWDKEFQVQSFCWNDLEETLKNKMLEASYIKVDTEGSDIEALTELLPVIKKTRPFILTEWWPFTEKEITEFVNANKYAVIDPEHKKIMSKLDLKNGYCRDLFLVPLEKLKEQKRPTCGHSTVSLT